MRYALKSRKLLHAPRQFRLVRTFVQTKQKAQNSRLEPEPLTALSHGCEGLVQLLLKLIRSVKLPDKDQRARVSCLKLGETSCTTVLGTSNLHETRLFVENEVNH